MSVATDQVSRNATRATPIARSTLLLRDPRGLYDFLSSDLLQEEIGWDCRGNNPYFLPTFVHSTFTPILFMDPLIDTLLTGAFAEGDPEEERLRLGVLETLNNLDRLIFTLHIWLTC